ncbi:HNH endonuclease signature motif containing protein [Mycolicibacter icosiumassiliensis]|uniref:HNH endonuclease signature motif containing protein n=1 Tax=Mycolicibacter icosiumassiliensis TaxID=1792835 RepID=UPI000834A64A|nr:HNH endonuclease signature motif containing protein [Mycolicibacter icosiumassiliensis]
MGRDAFADRETIMASLDAIEAAYDRLEACSFDGLSAEELVAVLSRREALAWRAPVVDHLILARLVTEDPGALGACSLVKVLEERLRISSAVARRRLGEAADLGPRTAVTGEPLEPVLPTLAAAQAAGRVGPEHVVIARKALAKIPTAVAAADRERAEADLAILAQEFGPETFARLADHLVAVLNPDGDFTDRERLAKRGLRLGRQGVDGMSSLSGTITPELRATLEPILAKLAAPGMCNAADEHPCVSGTPSQEQISADDRRPDQRTHDALLAAFRAVLACGDLGQLNGLPVTVIVTTTLAELHAATGHPPLTDTKVTGKAHTAGGSLLPMTDLLRMAEHAYHYLSVFDGKGRALWLGRSKRLATGDQRIVLHARDRGCTRPGCTVSGYLSQAHHAEHDWADNGRTDIDALALACAPDNRMATKQNWITRLGPTGRVEWIPPPRLDRGQPRTNPFHFIEAVIDYHRRRPEPGNPPDADDAAGFRDEQPPPIDPDEDWSWLEDPVPGDFDYDAALEDLQRSYEEMDFNEPRV